MHELSICHALISQIENVATEYQACGIEKVYLQIGALSGVESQLLRQAYTVASLGTLADGAELVIEELPIRVRCKRCGAETEAAANRLVCGKCGDWHAQLISGDELLLASLELIH